MEIQGDNTSKPIRQKKVTKMEGGVPILQKKQTTMEIILDKLVPAPPGGCVVACLVYWKHINLETLFVEVWRRGENYKEFQKHVEKIISAKDSNRHDIVDGALLHFHATDRIKLKESYGFDPKYLLDEMIVKTSKEITTYKKDEGGIVVTGDDSYKIETEGKTEAEIAQEIHGNSR